MKQEVNTMNQNETVSDFQKYLTALSEMIKEGTPAKEAAETVRHLKPDSITIKQDGLRTELHSRLAG
jgi:hypothetical protein